MSTRPHDALFKSVFETPQHAAALLRDLLPPALAERIAWDTFEHQPGSFIDAALADAHSDLLFSTRLRTGEPALLYILFEHQSSADIIMPLRMLRYQVQIWERAHKDRPMDWLPPIISVLVSHVPGGWLAARTFEALFDPAVMAIPELAALVPRFSLIVEDLAHVSNDELTARSLAAFPKLALWLLRDARDPERLLANLVYWAWAFQETSRARTGTKSLATLFVYLSYLLDDMTLDEFHDKLDVLSTKGGLMIEPTKVILTEERWETYAEMRFFKKKFLIPKFGPLTSDQELLLRYATQEELDRYIDRFVTAASIDDVFA